jgi:hypothetical protein
MRGSLKDTQNADGIRLGEDGRMKRILVRRKAQGVACIDGRELDTLATIRNEVEIWRSLPHRVSANLKALSQFSL